MAGHSKREMKMVCNCLGRIIGKFGLFVSDNFSAQTSSRNWLP